MRKLMTAVMVVGATMAATMGVATSASAATVKPLALPSGSFEIQMTADPTRCATAVPVNLGGYTIGLRKCNGNTRQQWQKSSGRLLNVGASNAQPGNLCATAKVPTAMTVKQCTTAAAQQWVRTTGGHLRLTNGTLCWKADTVNKQVLNRTCGDDPAQIWTAVPAN